MKIEIGLQTTVINKYYARKLKQSLVVAKTAKKHLVLTVGNGDPMREVCIPHRIPRAWEQ